MKRWFTKKFIIKNIRVSATGFKSTKKDRFSGFAPGLHFEEWTLAEPYAIAYKNLFEQYLKSNDDDR